MWAGGTPTTRRCCTSGPRWIFWKSIPRISLAQGGAALAVCWSKGAAHYPVSLHGVGLSLGSATGLDPWHLDQLAALVQRIDPVRVSDHASFARGTFQGATVHAADLLPMPFTHEALDVLCSHVQQVQDRLGAASWWKTCRPICSWKRARTKRLARSRVFEHPGAAHRLPVAGGCEQYLCQCAERRKSAVTPCNPLQSLPRLAGCDCARKRGRVASGRPLPCVGRAR